MSFWFNFTRVPAARLAPWFLVAVTLLVFGRVIRHDFINYDDPTYVTANPHVRGGLTWSNVGWAFTTRHAANWHPLTWLSHMLDVQLFGMNPRGHHITSVLLHVANTLLLFAVLRRMTNAVWPSAFVAALFAVHPLHVESVAWVAERKDVLSTLFWMLTMWAYARYAERPGVARYGLALLFFALGLMAKPMLVTLPCVLLLLDFWPLGRVRPGKEDFTRTIARLCAEKLPLFALSAASCALTVWAQKAGGAVLSVDALPLPFRIGNAVLSYARYLGRTIWPADLAVFYPHPGAWPTWQLLGAGLLMLSMTAVAVWRIRRDPYLIVGWFWYLGTLVPVIGIVQVGGQSIADRYSYVPLVGLFVMIGWAGAALAGHFSSFKRFVAFAAGVVVAFTAAFAWKQTRHWRNSFALFEHALRVTSDNHIAHNNLGIALAERGKLDAAILHFQELVRIKPRFASAHNNLGIALASRGRTSEAIEHFKRAVEINPSFAEAQNNLGVALGNVGRLEEAAFHFSEAVKAAPGFADARYHLACALLEQRDAEAAAQHLREALRLRPDFPRAAWKLAWILATHPRGELRNGGEARRYAEMAIGSRSVPQVEALDTLAAAYAENGLYTEASAAVERAIDVAENEKRADLVEALQQRMDLYKRRGPFRDGNLVQGP